MFRVHPETTVNHDGQLLWPLPHKPVLVENKLKHDADLSEFEAVSKAPVGGRGPTKAEADAVAKLIGHPPLNAPKVRK